MNSKLPIKNAYSLLDGTYCRQLLVFMFKFAFVFAAFSGALLIYILIPVTKSAVICAAVFLIISRALYTPFRYSEGWVYSEAVGGDNVPVKAFFGGYNGLKRVFRAYAVWGFELFFKLIGALPFLLIIAVQVFLADGILVSSDSTLSRILIIAGFIFSLGALFLLYTAYFLRFCMVKFIMSKMSSLSPFAVVIESFKLTKGKEEFLLKVFLSLIPMYLASIGIVTCGFTFTVMNMTYATATEMILNDIYNNNITI
ncbi:MAG: hypothetical protein LBM87_03695 [Ruminococcus sp.]|jgi:hypothetical protein|nr:hypothetical protein [Ruminococcus sp.]